MVDNVILPIMGGVYVLITIMAILNHYSVV